METDPSRTPPVFRYRRDGPACAARATFLEIRRHHVHAFITENHRALPRALGRQYADTLAAPHAALRVPRHGDGECPVLVPAAGTGGIPVLLYPVLCDQPFAVLAHQ